MYNSLRNRTANMQYSHCRLSVGKQYIGEMKLAKSTGIYPRFGFAVKHYIDEMLDNGDIFDFEQLEEKYKRINIASYDKPENILMRTWFLQDTDIIIADVLDMPSVARAYIRERLLKNFEDVLAILEVPTLIYASTNTYENALVFFVYHIEVDENGHVSDAFKYLIHENFLHAMPEDLVARNFTYDHATESIKMKNHEVPEEAFEIASDDEIL